MTCRNWFYYHLGLHYSQTGEHVLMLLVTFYYHLGLHYSQTRRNKSNGHSMFYYHLGLHYSQTLCILII